MQRNILNHKYFNYFIYSLNAAILLYALISIYKIIVGFAPDYSVFYYSTVDMLMGKNPYIDRHLFTVYNYPPITNLLFMPLVVLPYNYSQALFTIISFASIFLIVYLTFKLLDIKLSFKYYISICSLYFITFPVKFTLGMGQINLVAYCLLLYGFYLYTRSRLLHAAIWLCVAILLKPVLVITLITFLIRKQWKIVLYIVSIGILLIVLSIIFRQFNLNIYYISNVLSKLVLHSGQVSSSIYYNQGLLAVVSRFTSHPNIIKFIYYFSVLMFTIFTILFAVKSKVKELVLFSILLSLILLIDPISWQHHFVILLLPFMLLIKYINKFAHFYKFFIIASYTLILINVKQPTNIHIFPNNVFLSHDFIGNIIIYILLIHLCYLNYKNDIQLKMKSH